MNHAAPTRTGPFFGCTTELSAIHSLPPANTTCCKRSSFDASNSSWLPTLSASGVGPGFCWAEGGAPYTSVLTTALLSWSAGVAVLSEAVFVSAQTTREPLKHSALHRLRGL